MEPIGNAPAVIVFFLALLFGACAPMLPLICLRDGWFKTAVMALTEAVALYVSVTCLYGWVVLRGDLRGGITGHFGVPAALFMGYVLGYLPCRCLTKRAEKLCLSEEREPDKEDDKNGERS